MKKEGNNINYLKWTILQNVTLSYMIQCLPQIFFPLVSDEKYKINKTWIGIVLSLSCLGGILFSIFYQEISRKLSIIQYNILLQVSMTSCCAIFGLASLFENKWIFLFLSGIARLISGMAVGGIGILSYEYIILIEPEMMKQNIALTEMGMVVGYCMGSPFSYILYQYFGGYLNMFLCTSIILTLNAIQFFYFFIKYELQYYIQNHHQTNDKDHLIFQQSQNIYQIVLNSKQILITFIIIMGISLNDLFVISDISVYYKNVFGYNNFEISIFFLLPGLGYLIVTILFYQNYIEFQNNKKCLFYSYITTTVITFFLGWQKEWGMPFIFYQPFVVSLILGSAMVIGFIQSIPEFIDLLNQIDDSPSKQAYYTEMGSLLYVFSFQLGGFLGPMLGGIFFDIFGFTRGVNIFILLSFTFIAFPYFLIFNQYFLIFNNNLDNYSTLQSKNTQTQMNNNI